MSFGYGSSFNSALCMLAFSVNPEGLEKPDTPG